MGYGAKIAIGLTALLTFPLLVLYEAWIYSTIWNWFVPQWFGLPALTLSAAVLLEILIRFHGSGVISDTSATKTRRWGDHVVHYLARPAMLWLIAWVAKGYL